MPRVVWVFALAALAGVLALGAAAPVSAQGTSSRQYIAQRRPHITIHPRRHRYLPPNATRHCVAWLAKEYRVSGTVITPQQRCWWQY